MLKAAAKAARSPARTVVRARERGTLAMNRLAEELLRGAGLAGRLARRSLRPAVQPLARRFGHLPWGSLVLGALNGARRGHRRYLRASLSRVGFFEELNRRGVRYALLWWWQEFPELPAGEEIDILVEDDDAGRLEDLLVDHQTHETCDVLFAGGTGRGHHHGLPYFPPALAAAVLAGRKLYRGAVMVPNERMHFAALAYHAVFHKAGRSGLPGFAPPAAPPEHDYAGALRAAAKAAGIACEPSVGWLSGWLRNEGFAPGDDTLAKLIDRQQELDILANPLACDLRGGELCVFLIRKRAEDEGLVTRFCKAIADQRIEILESIPFPQDRRASLARRIRGGKWDRGPYPLSGGKPARLVVGYDYHPEPPTAAQAREHRWFTNRHVLEAKQACRGIIRRTRPLTRFYNGVHSADNEREAREYVAAVLAGEAARIDAEVERRRRRYHTRHPVLRILSVGPRAKVELIDHQGSLAVKKTFRIGFERFLERELLAARDLAKDLAFVPPLLEAGDGYVIVPHYDDVLQDAPKEEFAALLREHRSSVFGVIREMYDRGLAYIDFKPRHVIVTGAGEFMAIDYEFLQPYPARPPTVDGAYEVAGVSGDFQGDLPLWARRENRSFDRVWKPFVGSWRELRQLCS